MVNIVAKEASGFAYSLTLLFISLLLFPPKGKFMRNKKDRKGHFAHLQDSIFEKKKVEQFLIVMMRQNVLTRTKAWTAKVRGRQTSMLSKVSEVKRNHS